jgi:hypothetical protein
MDVSQSRINADTLQGVKYLDNILPLLKRYQPVKPHHNRKLHFDQYLALILMYFFNPVLTSLRGIQQASKTQKIATTSDCCRWHFAASSAQNALGTLA